MTSCHPLIVFLQEHWPQDLTYGKVVKKEEDNTNFIVFADLFCDATMLWFDAMSSCNIF